MNDTQQITRILADTTEKICINLCDAKVLAEAESGIWPKALWAALENTGIISASGFGDSDDSLNVLKIAFAQIQIMGRYAVPIPFVETFLASYLLNSGKNKNYSGKICLVLCKDGVRISGQKLFKGMIHEVPYGRYMDKLLLAVPHDFGAGVSGDFMHRDCKTSYYIVDCAQAKIEQINNEAGEPRDNIYFDDIPVAKINVFASWTASRMHCLLALSRALLMAGAMESTLELCIQYAKDRSQFGRPIATFQAIQQQLAVATTEVVAAIRAANVALQAVDKDTFFLEVAIAKARVGEAAGKVSAIAHQVHGAIGFSHEYVLHRYTRRLWCWRDEYDHEAVWHASIGRIVAAQGADSLWSFITKTPSILL